MKFCPTCGHPIALGTPPWEQRLRFLCHRCGTVHYQNPKIIVGTIPVWEEKILLCRRAIDPRRGYWTLPAGFLENGESTVEGAKRETQEEAGAQVDIGPLFSLLDLPRAQQVHLFFRAEMISASFSPGPESLETKLVAGNDIPWAEIAFQTVARTLHWFLTDKEQNAVATTHSGVIEP